MRKIGFVILLALIAAAYLGYPFYTMKRLVDAIKSGDTVVVDTIVDWKQVRDGLRVDAMRDIGAKGGMIDKSSSASTAGSMMGIALAGPMLDRMLESYLNGQALVAAAKKLPDGSSDLMEYLHEARFVAPTVFQYSLQNPKEPGTPVPVVMEFQGAAWRVVRVMVPSADDLAKVISKP